MPMFDDPREELRRLQAELLAAEEEEWEDDSLDDLDELLKEYGVEPDEDSGEADFEEYYEEETPSFRNYSNNYGRSRAAHFVDTEDYDDDLDEGEVLYRKDYRAGKKNAQKKGNRGLMIIICLELLGIAAVLGWWALWLL